MAQQNNLDFNIAANVKGMEQIATLINRVNALEAETKKLASANTNLTNSNNSVIQSGVRYNNALDAQSKQLRNARQGTQQLGMQINDFATSVSTGASISQAFSQQIGQVGYAMSMMGGTAGKVGSFLAGPWGALITIGAMALSPLINKLWETVAGAQAAEGALAALGKRREAEQKRRFELSDATKELNDLLEDRKKLEDTIQKKGVRDSQGRLMFVYKEQKELEKLNKQIFEARQNIDFGRSEKYGSISRLTEELNRPQTAASAATAGTGGGSPSSGSAGRSSAASDAQKAAEAANRYYANLRGEYVKEYQDYRTMQIKSAEFAIERMTQLEEGFAKGNIDRAVETAKAIEVISAMNTEKIAKDWDIPQQALQESFKSIGQSVSDAFKGMITGATSWKDAMKGIINSVIDQLWQLYVVQQIVGFVTKALGGLGVGGTASQMSTASGVALADSMFSGVKFGGFEGNANGTQNWRGGLSWVGERGPELVNLPRGAQVIPAHRAQSMGGSGININVDARGSADPAAVRAQVEQGILQAAPAIIAAAQKRTVTGLRRPKLGGVMQ